MQKHAAFVAGVSLLLFVTLPPTLTPTTQAVTTTESTQENEAALSLFCELGI